MPQIGVWRRSLTWAVFIGFVVLFFAPAYLSGAWVIVCPCDQPNSIYGSAMFWLTEKYAVAIERLEPLTAPIVAPAIQAVLAVVGFIVARPDVAKQVKNPWIKTRSIPRAIAILVTIAVVLALLGSAIAVVWLQDVGPASFPGELSKFIESSRSIFQTSLVFVLMMFGLPHLEPASQN
jgi:ABC-type transporter Mla maintaining outer membrane lipid asymmetry permease subunit MlaE